MSELKSEPNQLVFGLTNLPVRSQRSFSQIKEGKVLSKKLSDRSDLYISTEELPPSSKIETEKSTIVSTYLQNQWRLKKQQEKAELRRSQAMQSQSITSKSSKHPNSSDISGASSSKHRRLDCPNSSNFSSPPNSDRPNSR
ncbi:uncharacterized protein LOC142358745 [Convolutriloba macropyga]|uniref:uncharacterized protein LOC142358745 n=1 Tax=Convolutriloba macropyga TaxID=536237 RepID=UPI003F51CAC8